MTLEYRFGKSDGTWLRYVGVSIHVAEAGGCWMPDEKDRKQSLDMSVL